MTVLSGQTIREHPSMVTPFHERTELHGMTFGIGPAGYDVRVEFDEDGAISGRPLEPGDFMLASTLERFEMPRYVIGFVHDKSSWARRGLAVQNTVIEPGWTGYLTLELTNHSKETILLKRGYPIAQVVFHLTDAAVERPYNGKYQDQRRGPVEAR